ncbi:hypothetical protein [Bacillus sp. 3255]|uniref:hypothetical protein n=1 Tax=Bacillus sp. 3255 TaxID=2817904 RepID=UPI00285A489C|nr:hypothetical protein [Bacillus sp. 3255]MDR6882432.1 hypothetical protein [Bacillus sp. 3255]
MKYFWTNTIWYIILGIASIIELTFGVINNKRKKLLLGLFISIVGVTVMCEIIIMADFKSYSYYPKILPESWQHFKLPHAEYYWHNESIIGNYFSQVSVSATAILLATRNLKFYWYVISITLYCLVEELFLYLGIYSHNWYRTWMTFVGLIILFGVTKLIYMKSLKGNGRVLNFIYILFGLLGINWFTSPGWFMYLFGVQTLTSNLFSTPSANAASMYAGLTFLQGSIAMTTYFLKPKWWWYIIVSGFLFLQHYLLYIFNFNVFKYWWGFGVFSTTWILGTWLQIYILDKLYDGTNKKSFSYAKWNR